MLLLKASVRTLVEHCLRKGDLTVDYSESVHPLDGIRAHQRIQRSRPPHYEKEVSIHHRVQRSDCTLEIQGRIDGILRKPEGVVLEEIKTTQRDLGTAEQQENRLHWGQLMLYAAMYALNHDLDQVQGRLTYTGPHSRKALETERTFSRDELEYFFEQVVVAYIEWARAIQVWQEERDRSLREIGFPFSDYRNGQRGMAIAVYRAIKKGSQLLLQAPTGIGKTMAVLFPAVKAVGEGVAGRIVYLTARTTGQHAALKALAELAQKGLRLKSVALTAKERICFNPGRACCAEECDFAKGYYDRIGAARREFFTSDTHDRSAIETVARSHRVCPFQLSLDLAKWADFVICDYNYVFDPGVSLRTILAAAEGNEALIVDEAHNLVDRSRAMFSPELGTRSIRDLRRQVRGHSIQLYRSLGRLERQLAASAAATGLDQHTAVADEELPTNLHRPLRSFSGKVRGWLSQNATDPFPFRLELMKLLFGVSAFAGVLEHHDSTYAAHYTREEDSIRIRLLCRDPSPQLSMILRRFGSAVLFSGTMTPLEYFRRCLGCCDDATALTLPSPFPPENTCVLVADRISTTFQNRQRTRHVLAGILGSFVLQHTGNYLLFFPSYRYLEMVLACFSSANPGIRTIVQAPDMTLQQREEFLQQFSARNEETLVGFAVMGGIFGEGIDLVGERLSGAAIVGVGLPAVCLERDLIRSHFTRRGEPGFDQAYRYPGMNRVLQAAGRVIRSEADRGAILLVDSRFSRAGYRELLPSDWQPVPVRKEQELAQVLRDFWNQSSMASGF